MRFFYSYLLVLSLSLFGVGSGTFAQNLDSSRLSHQIDSCQKFEFSKPDTTIFLLKEYINTAADRHFPLLKAKALINLASIYKNTGRNNESIEACLEAIKIYDSLNYSQGLPAGYLLVGHNYVLKQNYPKGDEYYRKAYRIAEGKKDTAALTHILMGLGNMYMYQDSLQQAMRQFEKAKNYLERQNKRDHVLAGLYANLGNLGRMNEQYNKSRQYYLNSLELFDSLNNGLYKALVTFNLGDLEFIVENYDLALEYYRKTLKLGQSLKSAEDIKYAYKGMAKAYAKLGNFESAYEYIELYHEIKDSLNTLAADAKVTELELKYETEKTERELKEQALELEELERQQLEEAKKHQKTELRQRLIYRVILVIAIGLLIILVLLVIGYRRLKKKNEIISKQSEDILKQKSTIDEALKEKSLLLQEIHHRVKNNLQLISSMLNLQASNLKNKDAIAALNDSKYRVQAISLIHEKLYGSEKFATVNIQQYVEELIMNQLTMLDARGNKISYKLNIDNTEITIDTAVPLGLIISELVSNSLKHAFNGNRTPPEITVSLHEYGNGRMELQYADNGTGLPPNFELSENTSLGFEIISALTEQLEGTLTVQNGDCFKATIALVRQEFREDVAR